MTDTWQVKPIATHTIHAPGMLEEGWEPFAVSGGVMWLRRRVEPIGLARAITPKEMAKIARKGSVS